VNSEASWFSLLHNFSIYVTIFEKESMQQRLILFSWKMLCK